MKNLSSYVKPENVDGFFVLYNAMLHGLSIKRMPGQLLLLSNSKSLDSSVAFVHSVAQSTRLSTTTFVLQKRFRRAIFQRHSIPVPPGATFSFVASQDPLRYARKIGFPVVVKEVFGENPSFSVYDVHDKASLQKAIKKVREHLPVSAEATPSSYAQTINLGSAEILENGGRKKSSKSRFVVEKQLDGELFRVYVVGSKARISLKREKGDLVRVVDTSIEKVTKVAEAAVTSISGISNAAVDVVKTPSGECYIVEFCERLVPPKYTGDKNQFELVNEIYSCLLQSEASNEELSLSKKRENGDYRVSFYGLTEQDQFYERVKRVFHNLEINATVTKKDIVRGSMELILSGKAVAISLALEFISESEHISYLTIKRKKILELKLHGLKKIVSLS